MAPSPDKIGNIETRAILLNKSWIDFDLNSLSYLTGYISSD